MSNFEFQNDQLQKDKIKDKLNELARLKNIIIGNNIYDRNKKNILEYVFDPKLINFEILKNKITLIFKVNNTNEIYTFLLEELNEIYKVKKQNQQLKSYFYKIIDNLNFFICYSLIYLNDNDIMSNALEYFNNYIINDKDITKIIISAYINIFNLSIILYDYCLVNKIKFLSVANPNNILNIVDILKLQYDISYKLIIKEKSNNFANKNLSIFSLYDTYNTNLKEIKSLTEFIIMLKTNFIEPSEIKKILNDENIINSIDNNIKILIIDKLMKKYSFKEKMKGKDENELIIFYNIISNYINIIPELYINNLKEITKVFNYYINNNNEEKIINLINNVNNDCIRKYLDHMALESYILSLPYDQIIKVTNAIKNNKKIINSLLSKFTNKRNKEEGLKIIKLLNLQKGEYDKIFDDYAIDKYLEYKIRTCYENNFDILLEYGLLDKYIYNRLFFKLLKKIQNIIGNSKINNIISLNEDEEEEEQKTIKNKKRNTKNLKEYQKYKKNEYIIEIEKQKILYLYYSGDYLNFKLNNNNNNLYDKIFKGNKLINLSHNYNLFLSEDKYGPLDTKCIQIDLQKTLIIFVDNIKNLEEIYNTYFKNSKYVGIDSEWREAIYLNEIQKPSILQLANEFENCVIILDLIKIKYNKPFYDKFTNYFQNKIFIGYDFNRSDISKFDNELQSFFIESKIIDLINLYQIKYFEKAESLSKMCKKNYGQYLCKYYQCSNWDIRPLTKRQMHYAALDALICIKLYKTMI